MILGIDTSTYLEEIANGAKYFDNEIEVSPLDLFRKNGVECMRIRLWVNPYSEDGKPYLAGTCDFENFVALSKVAMQKGYSIMLDIHYSDFWADPGKQFIPKSWTERDPLALSKIVYDYTLDVLQKAQKEGINIAYIQVGNEITNGMLWPVGKLEDNGGDVRTNYDKLIAFLNAGIKACRESFPQAEIILHLERSHDQHIYNEFFDMMSANNVDFDIIGMSYYPYWHGTFEQYFANVENIKKYGKKIFTVELGYAFTVEDYIKDCDQTQLVIGKNTKDEFGVYLKYPLSVEGQARFTKDFLTLAREHGVDGVFWWEPLWIPGENICWASKDGQAYICECGKSTRNEWANQCLFDYDGKKLPSFDAFTNIIHLSNME